MEIRYMERLNCNKRLDSRTERFYLNVLSNAIKQLDSRLMETYPKDKNSRNFTTFIASGVSFTMLLNESVPTVARYHLI